MEHAQESATAAGRALSRVRWGSTRVDRLAEEIATRADDLSPQFADLLRAALREPTTDDGDDQ